MCTKLDREAVVVALRAPLPGGSAHARMRPRSIPEPPAGPWKEAAVLVLLYPSASGLAFPLLLRSQGLAHHSGQVGLPGGSRLEGERLADTALRETEEEIGVNHEGVELLGALSPLRINRSGFELWPFVGWIPQKPAFSLQTGEVADLIEAELTTLLDPRSVYEAKVETGDISSTVPDRASSHQSSVPAALRTVPAYRISGLTVWGATAMVLSEFTALLSHAA